MYIYIYIYIYIHIHIYIYNNENNDMIPSDHPAGLSEDALRGREASTNALPAVRLLLVHPVSILTENYEN